MEWKHKVFGCLYNLHTILENSRCLLSYNLLETRRGPLSHCPKMRKKKLQLDIIITS